VSVPDAPPSPPSPAPSSAASSRPQITRSILYGALALEVVALGWGMLLRYGLRCDPLRPAIPVAVVPLMLGAVFGISSAATSRFRALGFGVFFGAIVVIALVIAGATGLPSC
jgi:hypothetical protein